MTLFPRSILALPTPVSLDIQPPSVTLGTLRPSPLLEYRLRPLLLVHLCMSAPAVSESNVLIFPPLLMLPWIAHGLELSLISKTKCCLLDSLFLFLKL